MAESLERIPFFRALGDTERALLDPISRRKTYRAGEMFMETPNQLHAVSRNASATQPAKLLAVLLAEKGKPLTAPAK